MTEIINIDRKNIDSNKIKYISEALKDGKLVVFPTETVYGIGANGFNEEACGNIFKVKGRPADNPLILHVADEKLVYELAEEVPQIAKDLMDVFWPGPLTLILRRSKKVSDIVTAGLETVAIRMPSNEIARAILKESKIPIAAPSANISGRPSGTNFKMVNYDFNDKVDIIVDGGSSSRGIESTVVDLTVNPPMILRPGSITKEDIKTIIDDIEIDTATIASDDKSIPKSPGQKYKHYAPKAEAYCFVGNLDNIVSEINKRILQNKGKKIAVLATAETADNYENVDFLINLGSRDNLEEVARNLFQALAKCDEENVDIIYAEGYELIGLGVSIMNRLLKACGGRVVFGL